MTREDQRKFIEMFIASIKESILDQAWQWPLEWEGIELKELVKDAFARAAYRHIPRGRKMAYKNEVSVRGLL